MAHIRAVQYDLSLIYMLDLGVRKCVADNIL